MRDELVAIDLEATGLDPATEAVIEVGAVRMKAGVIIDEYSTMVNPERPIPAQITYITGIRQEDVSRAPTIETVLPEISLFVGNAPVIAHNISLDMGFLQEKYHILQASTRIDTFDLASVLLPRAARYNLNSLTQDMGIVLENAHRALDDARATALLYWELWKKLLTLPRALLKEITISAQQLQWDAALVFSAALQEMEEGPAGFLSPGFTLPQSNYPKLMPNPDPQPLDANAVAKIADVDGQLAQTLNNFEERPHQMTMIRAIAESFNNSRHLLVEAGTGIGKSLAYLIPAAMWSAQNQQQVVISTNTINLQDQLIQKDIPLLREVLDIEFTASVMKGRSNYLCPRRLETVRRRRPTSLAELKTLAKILVWLLESPSGDRGEISLRGPVDHNVWNRLSAQDEGCSLHRCETTMRGVCPFYKARREAEGANLLVINHALLISDAHTDNQVLPDYRYAIIDEAHQLEDAVTNGLTFHFDRLALLRRLADLGGLSSGLLGEILANARDHIPAAELIKLEQFVQSISEVNTVMQVHVNNLFVGIQRFVSEVREIRPQDYFTLVRIEAAFREKSSFAQVQAICKTLDEFFEVISKAMLRLTRALGKMAQYNVPELNDFISSAETAARYLQEVRQQLNGCFITPDERYVYWVSVPQTPDETALHAAPVHVGPMMENYIWNNKESIILTSATLRANDSFEYIKERLYADQVNTLEIGSPFNYRDSTLVYIPHDIPEPTDRTGYQRAVERGIIELAAALGGRVLVLFTSYAQLRQTAQAIAPRLALGDITVYDQSDGSSRQALLEGFKSTEKAVLMGTKSFWEGVDIPGESLSALVITRLPFAVPSDPIFAARSDTYNDSFNQYALPEAIIRFRQGFGRLIRSRTDRGVVTIFDRRVISKRYGAFFLEALPDCTMRDGTLNDLPTIAKNWLDR
ncbi:MAG: helicase C-terminal domain-containing protein [Anaerolineae bacterium]